MLDLKTTGIDADRDRIVEFAAIRCESNGLLTRRRQLINPGIPIPIAATAAHGITDQDVANAPSFPELALRLASFIGDADLAGFNIRLFDLPILIAECERSGLQMQMNGRSVVDAAEIFLRAEPRTLNAALKRWLGTDRAAAHAAAAHGALADAEAAAEVLDSQVAFDASLPIAPAALQRLCGLADCTGRFHIIDTPAGEEVVFAFRQHRGRSLVEVARTDPAYLRRLLASDFADDARELVKVALGEQNWSQ